MHYAHARPTQAKEDRQEPLLPNGATHTYAQS